MRLSERELLLLGRTFLDYRATREFLAHPLIVERAQGLYVWDRDGRRYLDAIGGIFVAVLGHRHPRVIEAMERQMAKVTFAPPLHSIASVTLDLIERLGEVTPGALKFVKPYSGGSEAVESALKFARQYFRQSGQPGKYKFISRYHSYHGATYGAMGASGSGVRKAKFEPQMGGFWHVFPPTHYRRWFADWDEANRFAARAVEDLIEEEGPETVAGVLLEPIGNTGGIITPTAEYFRLLREICDRHQVLLIFDEIITGFGKTGRMFAAQTFGVTPDILCVGKGMSSGAVPAGAMIAREDMAEAFAGAGRNFAHGHTFAGNPLVCAAALAVIDTIVAEDLCAKAERLGAALRARLERLRRLGVVWEIRGKGVLLGVEFTRDPARLTPFPELGAALKRTALENGILLRVDANWFAVAPPLIAEEADVEEMCHLIEKSLSDALARVSA